LSIDSEIPVLTGILFGRYSLPLELERGGLRLIGAPRLIRTINKWLSLSYFAPSARLARIDEFSSISGLSEMRAINDK